MRRFEGRAYFDFTAVQWCLYDSVGILPAETMKGIGGSHGAIVAREYGLPAVVNIPGILHELTDGSEIRVDAEIGSVELLR